MLPRIRYCASLNFLQKNWPLVHHYFVNSHSVTTRLMPAYTSNMRRKRQINFFAKQYCHHGGWHWLIHQSLSRRNRCHSCRARRNKKTANGAIPAAWPDWLQSEVQKKDLAFWKVAEQQTHRLLRALEESESSGRSVTDRTGLEVKRNSNILKIGLRFPVKLWWSGSIIALTKWLPLD